jgi:hypothetical protein
MMWMQGAISDEVISEWLSSLSANAQYVSLHFDLPDWQDPGASEVFDAGYARSSVAWSNQSNRTIANIAPVPFNVALSTNIAALGFHRSITTPELLAYAVPPSDNPIIIPTTGQLILPTGDVVLGFA